MHYFGNSNREDIHSVGLVFEPNFFRVYYYSDREAQKLVAAEEVNNGSEPENIDISKLYPLYALTFNTQYTLMPNDLFDEEHAQEILAFNTESNSPNVDWNSDPVNEAKVIFDRDIHSEQYLDRVFPGLQLKHGALALISYCRNVKDIDRFSVLSKNSEKYTLAIVEDHKIRYINSIDARHTEDVIYFLLFTQKNLGIEQSTPLYLLGTTESDSGLKAVLQKYLASVHTRSPISTNSPLSGEDAATHWIGVHAYLCAL